MHNYAGMAVHSNLNNNSEFKVWAVKLFAKTKARYEAFFETATDKANLMGDADWANTDAHKLSLIKAVLGLDKEGFSTLAHNTLDGSLNQGAINAYIARLNTFKVAFRELVIACGSNNTMSIIITHRMLGGAAG